jgi:hypothetical protein
MPPLEQMIWVSSASACLSCSAALTESATRDCLANEAVRMPLNLERSSPSQLDCLSTETNRGLTLAFKPRPE